MKLRRLIACTFAAALAAGLASCASAGRTTTAEPVLLTVDTFAETIAAGQASLDEISCTFEMTTTTAGVTMNARGAMRAAAGGAPEMVMEMTIPEVGTLETRFVDGMVYANLGAMTGGKFVVVDPSDPTLDLGDFPDVDPARDVDDIADGIVSVTPIGAPEVVDGVETQQYAVVVDVAKVTGAMRGQLDEAAEALAAQGVTMADQLTYHYWVDADGLMRRMDLDTMGVQISATFSNWGEPVEVQAPSPDQIVELGL